MTRTVTVFVAELWPGWVTVTVSFARDQDKLWALAAQIGAAATDPARAVAQAEVVVISVPWGAVDTAIEQVGGPRAPLVPRCRPAPDRCGRELAWLRVTCPAPLAQSNFLLT